MHDPIKTMLGSWSAELTLPAVLLRIGLSLLFAAVIGCERSSKRHSAGLRTFILVSIASTVAMMLDLFVLETTGKTLFLISAASVVGIAIISVNSMVFSSRNEIKGLTTSVGLWACGLMGLAAGAGYYSVAVISFAALLLSLSLFPAFEVYLKNRSNHFEVHLELKDIHCLQNFVVTIRELGMKIDDIESNSAYLNSGLSVYTVSISIKSAELKQYKSHREIIEALSSLDYILHIEEI